MAKDKGLPYEPAPSDTPVFDQPEDAWDLINKYGTYNIQPTADTKDLFPMIAPGLGEKWKKMAMGKEEVDGAPYEP